MQQTDEDQIKSVLAQYEEIAQITTKALARIHELGLEPAATIAAEAFAAALATRMGTKDQQDQ